MGTRDIDMENFTIVFPFLLNLSNSMSLYIILDNDLDILNFLVSLLRP